MIPLSGDIPSAKGAICEKIDSNSIVRGTSTLKRGFAHMLKNGVVMDVTTVEQAQIAEEAGAVSVMVLDKLPSDVRKAGGVARTASIRIIEEIMDHVTIPVMAKCRIGHVYEARVLEETDVDMIDESEVLTPADENHHVWKWNFTTPFVNGSRSLAEALPRIEEGAALMRTKGEPGTGKTELARQISNSLGLEIIEWNIKSTTKAQQGLYEYDAVSRLRDSQLGDNKIENIENYIKKGKIWNAFESKERSVLLIDEIDKADIEFPNDLLQELDKMEFFVYETNEIVKAKKDP